VGERIESTEPLPWEALSPKVATIVFWKQSGPGSGDLFGIPVVKGREAAPLEAFGDDLAMDDDTAPARRAPKVTLATARSVEKSSNV
jgi:hypothetical protein